MSRIFCMNMLLPKSLEYPEGADYEYSEISGNNTSNLKVIGQSQQFDDLMTYIGANKGKYRILADGQDAEQVAEIFPDAELKSASMFVTDHQKFIIEIDTTLSKK